MYVVETFPIDQADGVVGAGKSFAFLGLVLEDAVVEVVGHADVERAAGAALHDVHVVVIFAGHELTIHCHPERRTGSALAEPGAVEGPCVFSLSVLRFAAVGSVMVVTFLCELRTNARSLHCARSRFASVGMTGLRRSTAAGARLPGTVRICGPCDVGTGRCVRGGGW